MASRLLVFETSGERFALPLERVREVVEWQQPRALGAEEPWLLGVIALRGELLQVADLARRLGLEPAEPRRLVVFDGPQGPAALAVGDVDAVVDVPDESVRAAPPGSGELVAGIAARDADLVVVLDADALLGPKPPPRRRRSAPRKR